MSVASRCGCSLLLAATALIGSPPAAAQDAAAASPRWELSVTPYLWATALKGDVGVGRIDADVDASFDDILDNLNFALMLSLEARKGRFGLLSDTVYANLEDNAATARGSAQDRRHRQHADPVAGRDLPGRHLAARRPRRRRAAGGHRRSLCRRSATPISTPS